MPASVSGLHGAVVEAEQVVLTLNRPEVRAAADFDTIFYYGEDYHQQCAEAAGSLDLYLVLYQWRQCQRAIGSFLANSLCSLRAQEF